MNKKPESIDDWRNYFNTANTHIFDVIDQAILIAAIDYPKMLIQKRPRITERLYSCNLTRCSGCNRVELLLPGGNCNNHGDAEEGNFDEELKSAEVVSKESKANSSKDDDGDLNMNMNMNSNYSYGDAEALTDMMEEQSQFVGEVLRIKEVLCNFRDETDSALYESLRRLQLMELTVDVLQETKIGKVVNRLCKHGSKQISRLAQNLVTGWMTLVKEFCNTTKALKESTPDSGSPPVDDEDEGLPSPPMDEAFLVTQPTSLELSQFFDGMDDDGNPRSSEKFIKGEDLLKTGENTMRCPPQKEKLMKLEKEKTTNRVNGLANGNRMQQKIEHESSVKPKGSVSNSDREITKQKLNKETKPEPKSLDKVAAQRRPFPREQSKSSEDMVQVKLEAAKRRLQERYQQVENAKRQRTIQVMELGDLPKQRPGRISQAKPSNHSRHRANARR